MKKRETTVKKQEIKSVSLSVDEIRQLLSIESAEERKEVLDVLTEGAANPEAVDAERYLDSHPMALCLAHKISRKVEQRRQRAESKLRRQAEEKKKERVVTAERPFERIVRSSDELNEIVFNQTIVKWLLWLKRNHSSWRRSLFGVLKSLRRDVVPQELVGDLESAIEGLWDYLKPLVDRASDYYRTPSSKRCPIVVF